jgi:hypothetical protein
MLSSATGTVTGSIPVFNTKSFIMDNDPVNKIIEILGSLKPDEQIQVLRTVKAQLAQLYLRESDRYTKASQDHKQYSELLKANL